MARREHTSLSSSSPWQRPEVLLVMLALVLNANTLTHSWALDDTLLITDNKFTKEGFAGLAKIWGSDVFTGYFGQGGVEVGGRYRPLSQSVFAVCYGLFGANPFPGHLVNVVLYALTGLLLFRFLQRVLPAHAGPLWTNVPFLAAVLYAVHPLHCEVVANIKSLDELLAMALSLLCARVLMRWAGGGKAVQLVPGALLFFLALTAKENAVTFLGVVPLALHMARLEARRIALATATLLVPLAGYLLLRASVMDPSPELAQAPSFLTDPFFGADAAQRLATVCLTWWKYVALMVLPIELTTDHYPAMIPVVGGDAPLAWAGLLALAVPGMWALWKLPTRHPAAFGILYFVLTFSVVSNLVIDLGTPLNDRFLFMPLAGFAVAVAWLLVKAQERGRPQMVRAFMLVALVAYAGRTVARNADWKDDITLFTHDVQVSANSARCQVMTGKLYYEQGTRQRTTGAKRKDFDRAVIHLRRALEIHPDHYLAWGLLGLIAMDEGRDREAAEHFEACLRSDADQPVAVTNLAFVARRMARNGDAEGADRALAALHRFAPDHPDPYLVSADLRMREGRADSALVLLDRLIALAPGNADAHRMRGEVLAVHLHRPAEAEASFLKAFAIDPTNVSVLENLGVAAFTRNDLSAALGYFLKAVERRPNDARLLGNVASTYGRLGDTTRMQEYLERARRAGSAGN